MEIDGGGGDARLGSADMDSKCRILIFRVETFVHVLGLDWIFICLDGGERLAIAVEWAIERREGGERNVSHG